MESSSAPPPNPSVQEGANRLILLGIVFFCSLLIYVNMGCITAATPDLSGSFVVGMLDVSWSGAACPLGMMAALTFAAYPWARIGLRRSLRFALLLILAGAAGALIADHFLMMIISRFLQGFGSGMALVYGTGLINAALPPESRAFPTSLRVGVIGLGSCASPVIGCLFVQFSGWRSLFVAVALAAILLIILTSRYVPNAKIPKSGKFDWFSFLMILTGCLCIIMILIDGETDGWTSPVLIAWLYGGVSAFTLALISCLTHKTPLLDFRLLGNARFLCGMLASLCNIFCVCWVRSGTVQYMRNIMGYEPMDIAVVLMVLVFAFCLGSGVILPLMSKKKIALRVGMMAGMISLGGSGFFLSRLNTGSSWLDIAWPLAVFGLGYALCMHMATPLALRGVPAEKIPSAARMLNSMRYLFICFYISSVSTVLAHMKTAYHFSVAERTREGAPETVSTMDLWQSHFSSSGFSASEAHAGVQAVLSKAVALQSQVFSADYFYLCTVIAGALGVLFAFLCVKTSKPALLS